MIQSGETNFVVGQMDSLDFDNLEKMITEKYISRQKHHTLDLYIHNYTHKAQFDRVWNNETLQCRGLILDSNNRVMSRPFGKFFNLGELGDIEFPEGDFTVTEKMDGSLGISYFDPDGKMYIATRGSFVSDQAKRANQILQKKFAGRVWSSAYTWLFEIIYPENRIIIDYGNKEDLVLLSLIDTETGQEADYDWLKSWYKGSIVERHDGITDFKDIVQRPNSEGYVVHFPGNKTTNFSSLSPLFASSGFRFKVKFEEYARLHKIVTGVNAKRVWEFLKEGQPLDSYLERVPDEFYQWITGVKLDLKLRYSRIETLALNLFTSIQDLPTRKDQALVIKDSPYRGIVFNMLDGKPYDQIIWKMIEPEFERPFKAVDEATA